MMLILVPKMMHEIRPKLNRIKPKLKRKRIRVVGQKKKKKIASDNQTYIEAQIATRSNVENKVQTDEEDLVSTRSYKLYC